MKFQKIIYMYMYIWVFFYQVHHYTIHREREQGKERNAILTNIRVNLGKMPEKYGINH